MCPPSGTVTVDVTEQAMYELKKGKSKEQMDLLHAITRIAVTCAVAMLSSFSFFAFWLSVEESLMRSGGTLTLHQNIWWLQYSWCIDSLVNLVCVYLSMGINRAHYDAVCGRCCKCHQ